MTRDTEATTNSRVTTDHETVRRWARDHDLVPVTDERAGTPPVDLVERSRGTGDNEEIDWDRFQLALDDSAAAVVYYEDIEEFEVMERAETVQRATVESEAIEDALLEGETITTDIRETTVIERTVVEEAEVESEIVDHERIDSELVDATLDAREIHDCTVRGPETIGDPYDREVFESGSRTSVELDVEVLVTEDWTLTTEQLDRYVVESKVVDTSGDETDTIESDVLQQSIDAEGVQETVVQSDLLSSGPAETATIQTDAIESEFTEGNAVETRLSKRETVEENVRLERKYSGRLTDGETVSSESLAEEIVETEIGGEAIGGGGLGTGKTAVTTGENPTEAGTVPTEDDEGKTVIDSDGEEIGQVMRVEDNVLYVDPDPSLTDKVMRALDWGTDNDAYPVDLSHIGRITDDTVELTVDE